MVVDGVLTEKELKEIIFELVQDGKLEMYQYIDGEYWLEIARPDCYIFALIVDGRIHYVHATYKDSL